MPRTTELIRVRCFVAAHDLSGALAALPPPSELLITPQTFVPSEHPYKLHVGTYTVSPSSPPQQVYIGLTATPRNGYGPSLRIFIGNKTHSCHILEDAELLQPFRRLWEKSRFDGTGSDSVYKLIRRRVETYERCGSRQSTIRHPASGAYRECRFGRQFTISSKSGNHHAYVPPVNYTTGRDYESGPANSSKINPAVLEYSSIKRPTMHFTFSHSHSSGTSRRVHKTEGDDGPRPHAEHRVSNSTDKDGDGQGTAGAAQGDD
ncbi:hypothetical protein PMIN02_000847 [Paraphaeosphaeria minitans]|uniref:Uncharacterized protein n=1 Tax=Paraphaeosphaeria minitans TaxID=565426 RepID=A0A9P6GQL0_9PLEO|nr:hypothetical protein PMIN01_01939 [Paraphaeosphaeria minitans]